MNYKNRKIFSRLIFLGVFGLTVFGVLLMGNSLSKSQEAVLVGAVAEDFIPIQAGTAVLVEFSDFQCPACGLYYPIVKQLKAEFGNKLRVVYKHFPLKSIHKNADLAARASEAALIQDKFWEMHNLIFEKQDEWKDSSQAMTFFVAYAASLGLNEKQFAKDTDSNNVYGKVDANYREGINLGVNGTPTFFLNGKKIINPRSYDEFKRLIQNMLEQ